jgi:hypothetical protein
VKTRRNHLWSVSVAAFLAACGSDGGDEGKDEPDAEIGPQDAGSQGGPECFVPDECDEGEFCSAARRCEPRRPADGACELGSECQPGLFCLKTYEAAGLCKARPGSCPDDICGCYLEDSAAFCAGPPSNCDPTGQTIYCTALR